MLAITAPEAISAWAGPLMNAALAINAVATALNIARFTPSSLGCSRRQDDSLRPSGFCVRAASIFERHDSADIHSNLWDKFRQPGALGGSPRGGSMAVKRGEGCLGPKGDSPEAVAVRADREDG